MLQCVVLIGAFVVASGTEALMSSHSVSVFLQADKLSVLEGRSVILEALVLGPDGAPMVNCLVLPYVNGRRWGAHEITDDNGRARVILPLPNPGLARIQIRALPGVFGTHWVWTQSPETGTAYLATDFELDALCTSATLRAAINGTCTLYVNGSRAGETAGFDEDHVFRGIEALLRPGKNTLAIEARTSGGMPCVAAQMQLAFPEGDRHIVTDPEWRSWETALEGWPGGPEGGEPVRNLARLRDNLFGARHLQHWPGALDRDELIAGRVLPENTLVSNPVEVEVVRRTITSRRDPDRLVGMHWGCYFSPVMFWWETAQAVPLVGFYESFNRDVIRQHALWLMDIGVDFIYADWPFYVEPDAEGNQHWRDRGDDRNLKIHATALTLDVYAEMKAEGYPVPALVIMAYLANGPANTPETLNEKLEWIYNYFIRNPRFEGLWVMDSGKPLVTVLHNTMAPEDPSSLPAAQIDDTHFTIRYMGAQLQHTKVDKYGYWSWMDGVPEPVVTYRDDNAEAVTVSPSYFNIGGWLGPDAVGRSNGSTFLRQFRPALRERPRYMMLHQWNQFTGQYEGHAYPGGVYGDTYNVELSDDLEPVSLTADGYRGDDGGWGFYYMNIAKALVDLYKQPEPEDTLMAVFPPDCGATVTGETLEVGWEVIGKAPDSYTVFLDDVILQEGVTEKSYVLDLSEVEEGEHVLRVVAEGAKTRFFLSWEREDDRLDNPVPLSVDVPFVMKLK